MGAMDRPVTDKPFSRLSALLRGLQQAFVSEIGVDAEGLVLDQKVGELLGALAGLIEASDRVQRVIDELEWGDAVAYQALERAEAKAAGGK
jgi:hypothetical protein